MIECVVFRFDPFSLLFDDEIHTTSLVNLLGYAREQDIQTACLMQSCVDPMSVKVNQIALQFDVLIRESDLRQPLPDPAWFYEVQRLCRCNAASTVFFGRCDYDAQVAATKNIRFIGAPDGSFSHQVERSDYDSLIDLLTGRERLKKLKLSIENNHRYLGVYKPRDGDEFDRFVRDQLIQVKEKQPRAIDRWLEVIRFASQNLPKVDVVVRALGHKELEASDGAMDAIGHALAEQLKAAYAAHALRKKRETIKSIKLSKKQRFEQIENTYECDTLPEIVVAKSILLIDDVMTSGATMQEITRSIKRINPDIRVYYFTLVRTASHNDVPDEERSLVNPILASALRYGLNTSKDSVATPETVGSRIFSASYTTNTDNFIVQNIPTKPMRELAPELVRSIKLLRNLLQRGNPTYPSSTVLQKLGLNEQQRLRLPRFLTEQTKRWRLKTKGKTPDETKALGTLLSDLLPRYVEDWNYLDYMWKPFVRIGDTGMNMSPYFQNAVLDIFIPDLFLAIQVSEQSTHRVERLAKDLEAHGYRLICLSPDEILGEHGSIYDKLALIRKQCSIVNSVEVWLDRQTEVKTGLLGYELLEKKLSEEYQVGVALHEVIRVQLAFLEALESGLICIEEPLQLQVKGALSNGSSSVAVADIFEWLSHFMTLRDSTLKVSEFDVAEVNEFDFGIQNSLFIDMAVFSKYTDEADASPNVLFIRSSYQQKVVKFVEPSLQRIEVESADYFVLDTDKSLPYLWKPGQERHYEQSLEFLASNIFFPTYKEFEFREGQLNIVLSILGGENTIGLLPTGSGKSLCYQLAAVLQPSLSFVVCPIKSLMYDQKFDLDAIGFTRSNFITGDQSRIEKAVVQERFSQGKYFFVFISPERFQTKEFRQTLTDINLERSFAYAVIDEVHCVSEWGHDFRTSYLNLARTIEACCYGTSFVGLTATASVNVLEDIRGEFHVGDDHVKTPRDFSRPELSFGVLNDQGDKYRTLLNFIKQRDDQRDIFNDKSYRENGIVFTPHVNGVLGCSALADRLSKDLNTEVLFYSGSKPFSWPSNEKFDDYKVRVQRRFKKNKFKLMTATKAFGMGVNKGNISYTVHYGIPGSMEALYQEAGRAARLKQFYLNDPAECLVVLGEDTRLDNIQEIWNPESTFHEVESARGRCSQGSDIGTNLFMLLNSTRAVNDDLALIRELMKYLHQRAGRAVASTKGVFVRSKEFVGLPHLKRFGFNKNNVQQAIFRLTQLGIVKDWLVADFYNGNYEVFIGEFGVLSIRAHLQKAINRYDREFDLATLDQSPSRNMQTLLSLAKKNKLSETDFYVCLLLLWSYEHFVYNRKQSLKTVYEQCYALSSGHISAPEFKSAIEGYFRFGESSDLLKEIADDPKNYHAWFEILYKRSEHPKQLRTASALKEVQEQVGRFLESYRSNVGLNFISAILRLLFDDFDDADGEPRYHAALRTISQMSFKDQQNVFSQASKLFGLFDLDQQTILTESTAMIINNPKLLMTLSGSLTSGIATKEIINAQTARLSRLNNALRDIPW